MDFELLLSSPFYLIKSPIRRSVACWGKDFSGLTLDIGCGSGGHRRLLPARQFYVGLEYKFNLLPNVVGDALSLPFMEGSFNNLLCMEVLEHLPEPELALHEMARVCQSGGKLILSTPMTWYLHYEPNDFFRYTNYGLQHLFAKAGFQILEIERTGGFWTIVLSRFIEVFFHFIYALTAPIRWLTGSDRGRFRGAVILTIPFTFFALILRNLLESKASPYVQGWIILAEKKNV